MRSVLFGDGNVVVNMWYTLVVVKYCPLTFFKRV